MKQRTKKITVVATASLAVAGLAACGEQQSTSPDEHFAYSCQKDLNSKQTPDVDKKAPKAKEWTQGADGNTYPRSDEFGGCYETNGWKLGHSHNTSGAVFAATDYLSGPAAAGNVPTDGETIKKVYADGQGREQMLSGSPSASSSSSDSSFSGSGVRLIGYDLNEKDKDHVTITAHVESDMFFSGKIIVPLTWQDGDWKVQAHSPSEPVSVQLGSTSKPQVTWEE